MNNKSGSERAILIETLKKVACKTYLGNHKFHHILNNHECDNGYMVWEDLADYFLHLQKLCEEQKGEIERLMEDLSVLYKQHHNCLSQLATQTERVRKMTRALMLVDEVWTRANLYPEINHLGDDEHEAWGLVKQALKRENLGNGGKGEEELSMLYTRLAQVDLSRPSARDLRLGSQLHGITQNQDLRALRI